MRPTILALALTTLSLGLNSCANEPVPSTGIGTVTIRDTEESKVSSIESITSRIPLIDREAPQTFETATFALG